MAWELIRMKEKFHKWAIAWSLTFDKPAEKLVYMSYASHASIANNFTAFLAIATIAKETGLNIKTARSARLSLIAKNRLIDTQRRRGQTGQCEVMQLPELSTAYQETLPKMGVLNTPENGSLTGERLPKTVLKTPNLGRRTSFKPIDNNKHITLSANEFFVNDEIHRWAMSEFEQTPEIVLELDHHLYKFQSYNSEKRLIKKEWELLFKAWLKKYESFSLQKGAKA